MQQVKITLTPRVSRNVLIIGIQTEENGRLIVAEIPGLKREKKTVLEGASNSDNFRAKTERALATYVPQPHYAYSILDLLGQKGA